MIIIINIIQQSIYVLIRDYIVYEYQFDNNDDNNDDERDEELNDDDSYEVDDERDDDNEYDNDDEYEYDDDNNLTKALSIQFLSNRANTSLSRCNIMIITSCQ